MKNVIQKSLIATAATLALAASTPSFATANPQEVKVQYTPAELQFTAGRERVYRAVTSAAEGICGPTNVFRAGSIDTVRANSQCINETVAIALEKIGNDELKAMHERN